MLISLTNHHVTAVVDTLGAQLMSLKDSSGREYMWQRDPRFWAKTSPVLFPAIGNSRNGKTIFDGKWYDLPKHGFAKEMEFRVERQSETEVSMVLEASQETKRNYPYEFRFTMSYQVTEDGISIRYQVANQGAETMYYCLGAHPAFRCPMEEGEKFEEYQLQFENDEECYARAYDLKAMEFEKEKRGYYLNHTAVLPLQYNLFDSDAIYFENLKSKKVSLIHGVTGKGVEVDFRDFASVAFWTPDRKRAPFLCIEPWNGSAIRAGEDDEFCHKQDVQAVKAGEQKEYHLGIRMLPENPKGMKQEEGSRDSLCNGNDNLEAGDGGSRRIPCRMTTLCYLEQNDQYLMLHRVSKKDDENQGKWIGVGGHLKEGESPEECLIREVKEETGLTLTSYQFRGLVTFVSDQWGTEYMCLYTADGWTGELTPCEEGVLKWVEKENIKELNIWEGDRIFLRLLQEQAPFFSLKLRYEGDTLAESLLDGHSQEQQ